MKANEIPFYLSQMWYKDREFHHVCPECGRPFIRDFFVTLVHPQDPYHAGIHSGKFWTWVFLMSTIMGLALYLLASFGTIWNFLRMLFT